MQFALPVVGFRHCFRERRAAVFAASLAAGVAARTAAAARRAGTSIGARKDQRMHHIAFWCCSVYSDADLLRARHGGRHEGGGRRQRKRDEELVHLGCCFATSRWLAQTLTVQIGKVAHPFGIRRDSPPEIWRATSGRLEYTYGTASFKFWESAGRGRDTRS